MPSIKERVLFEPDPQAPDIQPKEIDRRDMGHPFIVLNDVSLLATTPFGLRPGWGVALVLRNHVGGTWCLVGEVQHVDGWGVRISAMDWVVGQCVGMDYAIPWPEIQALQVSTDEHSGWEPARFQEQVEKARKDP